MNLVQSYNISLICAKGKSLNWKFPEWNDGIFSTSKYYYKFTHGNSLELLYINLLNNISRICVCDYSIIGQQPQKPTQYPKIAHVALKSCKTYKLPHTTKKRNTWQIWPYLAHVGYILQGNKQQHTTSAHDGYKHNFGFIRLLHGYAI